MSCRAVSGFGVCKGRPSRSTSGRVSRLSATGTSAIHGYCPLLVQFRSLLHRDGTSVVCTAMPSRARTANRQIVLVALLTATLVGTSHPASAALPPDLWAGTTADFYVVPDPLPAGQPGDIIRLQLISQTGGATTLRVMYHSRDVPTVTAPSPASSPTPTPRPRPAVGRW